MQNNKNLLFAVILAAALSACSKGTNTPVSAQAASTPPAAENTLHMLTDTDGFMNKTSVSTEDGFYELLHNADGTQDGSVNLVYTDYQTLTRNYLCAEPACAHNTDACACYVDSPGILSGLFCDQGKLFLYIRPAEGNSVLEQANLDGSDRTPFFEFSTDTCPNDGILSDGDAWYYLNTLPQEDGKGLTRILKLSLATKQVETVYSFPQETEDPYYLIGGYGSKLAIKKNTFSEDRKTVVYAYDLAQNTLEELFACNTNIVCRVNGPEVIYCDLAGGAVRGRNLQTGADRSIYQDTIFCKYSTIVVNGIFDNKFLIQVTDQNIPFSEFSWEMFTEREKAVWKAHMEEFLGHSVPEEEVWPTFLAKTKELDVGAVWRSKFLAVDLAGDKTEELTLLGGQNQDMNIVVLAETAQDFCVYDTYKLVSRTFYDTEGKPYTTESREMHMAMISKEDYFAQKENYRPITDLTTS